MSDGLVYGHSEEGVELEEIFKKVDAVLGNALELFLEVGTIQFLEGLHVLYCLLVG